MTAVLDPYERIIFRDSKPLDRATCAALIEAEKILGYPLTVLQGVGGAPASGGTHLGLNGEGGRAVDLTDNDRVRKVKVLRDLGFAVWYRPELPGVWGPHIHAVLIFKSRDNRRGIAPLAFDQIRKYDAGQDGLAGSNPDPNPYRPSPPAVYTLAEFREDTAPPMNEVQKARDAIARARNHLGNAIAWCKDADGREVVQGVIPELKRHRAELGDELDRMPKK